MGCGVWWMCGGRGGWGCGWWCGVVGGGGGGWGVVGFGVGVWGGWGGVGGGGGGVGWGGGGWGSCRQAAQGTCLTRRHSSVQIRAGVPIPTIKGREPEWRGASADNRVAEGLRSFLYLRPNEDHSERPAQTRGLPDPRAYKAWINERTGTFNPSERLRLRLRRLCAGGSKPSGVHGHLAQLAERSILNRSRSRIVAGGCHHFVSAWRNRPRRIIARG